MNKTQLAFLVQLGERIPRLFDAIAKGNVKSEFIVGVRTINSRQVRLKLVAEVVDPGSNPLATHGQAQPRSVNARQQETREPDVADAMCSMAAGNACPGTVDPNEASQKPLVKRRTRRR